MELKDIITVGLAGYGAVLSTYNLVAVRQRDRKRLKVTMNTAMYTYPNGDLGPAMVAIEIVNEGHRPILASAPYLRLPDGRKLTLVGGDGFGDFPKQLGDGASATVRMGYREIGEALQHYGYAGKVKLTPICTDSAGTVFTGRPWDPDVAEWLRM